MENKKKKQQKNSIKESLIVLDKDKDRKQINWDKLKISFFLSQYKQARTFLVKENHFTTQELSNGNIKKAILGWEIEKKDWEKQALEITLYNLRETKAVEMKDYLQEEGKVITQLLNMTKVAMNNLMIKKKINGKDILELKDTKGFKQITEATLNILKYSRDRLGIAFDKESEGLKNAVNFNFDFVNLDEFEPNQLANLFKKEDAQHRNTKSIKTDAISEISEVTKT